MVKNHLTFLKFSLLRSFVYKATLFEFDKRSNDLNCIHVMEGAGSKLEIKLMPLAGRWRNVKIYVIYMLVMNYYHKLLVGQSHQVIPRSGFSYAIFAMAIKYITVHSWRGTLPSYYQQVLLIK